MGHALAYALYEARRLHAVGTPGESAFQSLVGQHAHAHHDVFEIQRGGLYPHLYLAGFGGTARRGLMDEAAQHAGPLNMNVGGAFRVSRRAGNGQVIAAGTVQTVNPADRLTLC